MRRASAHGPTRSCRGPRPRSAGLLASLRSRKALVRLVLRAFVGAFIVLPCLHNLDHRADHDHGRDGFSVVVFHHDASHDHARPHSGGVPSGSLAVRRSVDATPGAALESSPPVHAGPGAAGHFGVATLAPSVFAAPDVSAWAAPSRVPLRHSTPHVRAATAIHAPRGPPVS